MTGEDTPSYNTPQLIKNPLLSDVILGNNLMVDLVGFSIRSSMFQIMNKSHTEILQKFIPIIQLLPTAIQQKLFEVCCKNKSPAMLKYLNSTSTYIPLSCYYLDLSGCNLNQIPSAIFRCKNLHYLNLSDNNITEIPSDLCNLPLTELKLDKNPVLFSLISEVYQKGTKQFLEYLKELQSSSSTWDTVKLIILGKVNFKKKKNHHYL